MEFKDRCEVDLSAQEAIDFLVAKDLHARFQMRRPTGSSAFTANRILTEIRYHYSWEIVKDKVEFEANTIGYSDRDDLGQDYMVFVQTGNLEYSLTKEAELFFECYGLFPHGARSPIVLPQYYYHSGLTYFFTDNFAIYCHAAVGLNRHADDFYSGVGVLARR